MSKLKQIQENPVTAPINKQFMNEQITLAKKLSDGTMTEEEEMPAS